MMLSASCGEICNASVRSPRQLHGFFQPIHQRPTRYETNMTDNHAMASNPSTVGRKKQTATTPNSSVAASCIRCENLIPSIGSLSSSSVDSPVKLHNLATPTNTSRQPHTLWNHLAVIKQINRARTSENTQLPSSISDNRCDGMSSRTHQAEKFYKTHGPRFDRSEQQIILQYNSTPGRNLVRCIPRRTAAQQSANSPLCTHLVHQDTVILTILK